MAISWTAVQNALHNWVATASGLSTSQVIWGRQNGVQPNGDFIELTLGPVIPLGSVDAVETSTNLSRPAGQEIEHSVIGLRETSLDIQAHTTATLGNSGAVAMLSRVQTALTLPTVRDSLTGTGMSVFDKGNVQDIGQLVETAYEGRAVLTVRIYLNETVSEYGGYIASVEITNTSTGHTFTVTS